MPRACSWSPFSIVASWLLAAPQTTEQRSFGIESSFSAAPSAHGDSTSHSRSRIPSSDTGVAPIAASSSTRSGCRSPASTSAPASTSSRTSGPPTCPVPCTTTFRPASSGEPNCTWQAARIPS